AFSRARERGLGRGHRQVVQRRRGGPRRLEQARRYVVFSSGALGEPTASPLLVDRRGVRLDALERELEHLRDDGGLLRALGRRDGDAGLVGNGHDVGNGGDVEQRAGLFESLGIAVCRDFGGLRLRGGEAST